MKLRESLNNLIRSDRPESPTDVVFIYGGLILIDLWIYVTLAGKQIPHIEVIMAFLVSCKGVKVVSDKMQGRKAADCGTDNGTGTAG
jgi:hypothetical protein